ncbi:hypothetical protein EsH8_III_000006 [Colletotrichum jinshuiense]
MSAQAPPAPAAHCIYDPSKVTKGVKLPTVEDLHDYDACPEAEFLVWAVPGSLRDIMVLDTTAAPTEAFTRRQPFAIFGSNDKLTSFHPIASLPAIYPLVSRTKISIYNLEELVSACCRMAEEHEFNLDDDNEDSEADKYCICEGCKEDAAPFLFYKKLPKLYVDANEKPYVTLKDVVLAVNEWIPKIWNDILLAQTMTSEDNWGIQYPKIPADTKFWVNGEHISCRMLLIRQGRDEFGNIDDRERYWQDCAIRVLESKRKLEAKAVNLG